MLSQGTGGSVATITASLADNPIVGIPASVPMITKGGLNAIALSLASEYAKDDIRFNAVAPGVVDTPLHKDAPKGLMNTHTPVGTISDPREIAEALVYLTEAGHLIGEVLHVDVEHLSDELREKHFHTACSTVSMHSKITLWHRYVLPKTVISGAIIPLPSAS